MDKLVKAAAVSRKWDMAEVTKWLDEIYDKCGPCRRARRPVHVPKKGGLTIWERTPWVGMDTTEFWDDVSDGYN